MIVSWNSYVKVAEKDLKKSLLMRVPSATFIVTETKGSYIVLELPDREDCQVIYIDPERGYPSFYGVINFDIYKTKQEALNRLKNIDENVKTYQYYMVAGMFPIGNATIICFIKSVTSLGTIFKKHEVFSVDSLVFAVANKYSLTQAETKVLNMIESFPVKVGHFICHTMDLSMPLSAEQSTDAIWNRYISHVFDFFTIGRVCPNIIEGIFSVEQVDNYEIYYISRIMCETCGPIHAVRGTSQTGGLGNQTIVEVIVANYVGESIEIRTQNIVRGSTPISYKPNRSTPDLSPYLSIPVWVVRLTSLLKVEKLNIIDFNKEGSEVDKAIKDSLNFLGDNMNLTMKSCDWNNLKRTLEPDIAATKLAPIVDSFFNSTSSSYGFIDNEKITFSVKQDSAIVVTSQDGLDRCNIGLFLTAIRCIYKSLQNLNLDPSTNRAVITHIAHATIKSGNNVALLSVGREINLISDILKSASLDTSQLENAKRKRYSYDDNLRVKAWAVFDGQPNNPKLPMNFPSVFERIRCVSDEPGALVLSNTRSRQLFEMRPTILRHSDGPIVIKLNEPVYVTEIVIKLPSASDRRPSPSSVTINGGPFNNKMFPIITDAALPVGESRNVLSIVPPETNHYRHESFAPLLQLTRFLEFHFSSPFEKFLLLGIKIYGSSSLPPSQQRPQIPLSPITDHADFWEEPNNDAFIPWEERRLCALMPLNDYMKEVMKKDSKMNPGAVLAESIFRLYPSGLENDDSLCMCGKPASYRCALCRKYFCNHCNKPNDSQDTVSDPQNVCKLCQSCADKRYKMAAAVTKLVMLNIRMSKTLYPFIGTEEGTFYPNAPFSLINQVPIGKNGVSFEQMLVTGKDWEPEVSLVKVDICLKQKALIQKIILSARNPVDIIIGDKKLSFIPPGNAQPVEIIDRIVSFVIVGKDISISAITFEKADVYIGEDFPKAEKSLASIEFNYLRTKSQTNQSQRIQNILPVNDNGEFCSATALCIEITEVSNIKSFAVLVQNEDTSKFFRFCIPKISGTHKFFLPAPAEFRQLTVYYTESYGAFSMPAARALSVNVK